MDGEQHKNVTAVLQTGALLRFASESQLLAGLKLSLCSVLGDRSTEMREAMWSHTLSLLYFHGLGWHPRVRTDYRDLRLNRF